MASLVAKHCRSMSAPNGWSSPNLETVSCSVNSNEEFQYQQKPESHDLFYPIEGEKPAEKDRRSVLENDVALLQKRLEDEKQVRESLERALEAKHQAQHPIHNVVCPQTKELITEIASLELEVAHMEQHVLTLYRKLYEHQMSRSALSSTEQSSEEISTTDSSSTPRSNFKVIRKSCSFQHRRNSSATTQGCCPVQDITFHQLKTRHVSLMGGKLSIDEESDRMFNSKDMYQIQEPRSPMPEQATKKEAEIGKPFAELLKNTRPHSGGLANGIARSPLLVVPEHNAANKLSEELVRCMAAIYCKLADPPLTLPGAAMSPSSSSSSSSSMTTMSRDMSTDCSTSSPRWRAETATSAHLSDPFLVKGPGDDSGEYASMIEVPWIRVDKDRLTYAARALRNFRSMVEQLERVDPAKMKQDEKLAFWINVYNALMMHAYLAYGIPRSHLKRVSLLQKASYKIGSYSINAYTIEQSILGCRSPRPAQWLRSLLSPLTRFRAEERRTYALANPEPLVCFALCSGGRSDPAVRVYRAGNVKQELEIAKWEFLHASIGIKNDKVILPKVLEWYIRETGGTGLLLDWVSKNVSEKQRILIRKCAQCKSNKNVEWASYDFSYRYIFARDLAKQCSV